MSQNWISERLLSRLKQEIEQLMEVVRQQNTQIKNYAIYQQFMEHVLEVSPEVTEINIC